MKPFTIFTLTFFACIIFHSNAQAQASIRLSQPAREQNNVSSAVQFIAGRTCPGCRLTINNDSVYVYPTGAFAVKQILQPGKSIFSLTAEDSNGVTYTKDIYYYYNIPPAPTPTSVFRIDYIEISPRGNVVLSEGDTLRIKMKGYPGGHASWFNNTPLREQTSGVAGIYTGTYVISAADSLLNGNLPVRLQSSDGQVTVKGSPYRYRFMNNEMPLTGRTIDNMTYLTASPHGDRLGPDKTGYLDKDVLMQVVGEQGDFYKVRLARDRTAFIPQPLLDTDIPQEGLPLSIVSDARIWGDEKYDYVSIDLGERQPYLSTQSVSPGQIIVDIFGAYAEQTLTNQPQGVREISRVTWQQPAPDVFRMIISLHHAPWGYQLYYDQNRLTVKVKRVPEQLSLKNLVIGVDAGHGGSNVGAASLTGIYEKQMTLAIAMSLKAALEAEGATVITTRTSDQFVANEDRLKMYRQQNPDLLLSIHLNSSANPVDIYGTATYYKHPFCEPLSAAIHRRLLETGLRNFGNHSNFNFILNNPTEFPDVLVETLFLSNPGDEMKVLDPAFREEMVKKIVAGIKDYLGEMKSGTVTQEEE